MITPITPVGKQILTVSGTAVGLTVPAGQYPQVAVCTVEDASVRIWTNGDDPTAAEGHLCVPGTVLWLTEYDEVVAFRAIRESVDAQVMVTYYKGYVV